MPTELFKKIFLVFLIPLSFILISAQDHHRVSMEIRNESQALKSNIIDLILVIKNQETTAPFEGNINIKVPAGFRTISNATIKLNLKPGENVFLPVKILVSNDAASGEAQLLFNLNDSQGKMITQEILNHTVLENNSLKIIPENTLIHINNTTDSVEVRARVSNLGNKKQHVTVVFKIPEAAQENFFVEQKGNIGIQRDSVFVFRFMPSSKIIKSSQFIVNIVGFREPDKEIFGNSSVSIQNVSSVQQYQDLQFNPFSNHTKNSITASYRSVGNNIDMYQLIGSGGFNLPSGYIFMRGNIYTINRQGTPIVNNTYVSYHREKSEYTLGNINKMMEMPLFGRGAEYVYTSSDKNKKLEAGFVDQTFSLIETNSFLQNGYGFYAKGTLGAQNATENMSGTYIFREDKYDQSKHHVFGADVNHTFNDSWRIYTKMYGGLSVYESIDKIKPSLAAESQYSGLIEKVNLNGNYFYSTDYFPGNRRGMLLVQQNFSRSIFKDYFLFANVTVSNFSPKFYFFNNDIKANNTRLDIGLNFPKKGNFSFGVGYQYQGERSNSYNTFFGLPGSKDLKQMTARRFTEYTSWMSPNKKHSSMLSIEAGWVDYPDFDQPEYQMKISGNYNYKWFNFNYIYQYGSYFLSEYAFSKMLNADFPYKKLSLSSFFNKNFFKDKVSMTAGLAYTDDSLYGKSPSCFVNLKYNRERYGFFVNSSWYNYSSNNLNNNLFTIEAGINVNLQPKTLDKGKKSNLTAFVYYDRNNNNIFDEGDTPAADYLIMINTISFKTDSDGNIVYKKIPYGKYSLKQVIQQGWYYTEDEFEVDNHNYHIEVPLHQNGTVHGKISYDFNAKTSLEFAPKIEGIVFNVYQNDKLIQRIFTDDNGEFISFLPSGKYRIGLNASSLPSNTHCEQTYTDIEVQAGKITQSEPFIIKVKEKNIRVKKFGDGKNTGN